MMLSSKYFYKQCRYEYEGKRYIQSNYIVQSERGECDAPCFFIFYAKDEDVCQVTLSFNLVCVEPLKI